MFDTGCQPTILKLVPESAESELELVDSSAYCITDSTKIGVWIRALKHNQGYHVLHVRLKHPLPPSDMKRGPIYP